MNRSIQEDFNWSKVSKPWRKAISEYVDSIEGSETNLSEEQTQDLFSLTSLSYSCFSNDTIKDLYPIQYMTDLQYLALERNNINTIKAGTFQNLSKLEILNLEFNQIKVIENGAFSGLSNLVKLSLQYNQIKNLTSEVFKGMESLKDLELNDNQIDTIEQKTFEHLDDLRNLNLTGNRLRNIDSASLLRELNKFVEIKR